MINSSVGHCKHGEFELLKGCKLCIAERFHLAEKKQLVKVRYYSEQSGELSSREYTYYTAEPLKVGDVVMVTVRDTAGKAQVSAIDVPEEEVAAFKDKVKTIPAGANVIFARITPGDTGAVDLAAKPNPVKITSEGSPDTTGFVALPKLGSLGFPKIDPEGEAEAVESDVALHDDDDGAGGVSLNGAAELVAIANDPAVNNLLTEIYSARSAAEKFVVASLDDVKAATNDLALIAKLKKALTAKRKEYVDPLNVRVKSANDAFKKLSDPLEEADKIVRGKVGVFSADQERLRLRAEETNRMAAEVARRQAVESGTGEFNVDLTPTMVPIVAKTTRTEMGNSTMVDHWVYEVIDMELLPRAYMMPDDAILKAIATKYHDTHPVAGVRFENHPTLRVNTR